jgi:hypothetical protein
MCRCTKPGSAINPSRISDEIVGITRATVHLGRALGASHEAFPQGSRAGL